MTKVNRMRGNKIMLFNDLREFINEVERQGESKVVEGADWDLEIGYISEWRSSVPNNKLLIFDKIKDYPPGFRVATNLFSTLKRTTQALGLSPDIKRLELVKELKEKLKEGYSKLVPPIETKDAPVKENIYRDNKVDLLMFPTPKWHRRDGGRYIGTGHAVITIDPDEGWVNLGCYRVEIQDKSTLTIWMVPGRDADQMIRKWWAKGLNAPVAVAIGLDPILWEASCSDIPWGISEYDYAGGYRGVPIEVTKGVTVDLPIPARAEIVLEGEIVQDETREEGPFGEFTGYYATGATQLPAVKVKAILHRNDPIIHGAPPLMSPSAWSLAHPQRRAATAWIELDSLIPGITGVWLQDYASFRPIVISIKQMWDGHARQVAMLALSIHAIGFNNRFIIIVDDDIDPSDPQQVLWALASRCDPENQIDIVRGTRGSTIDPVLHPEKKKRGEVALSTAIVLACKPYSWMNEFPPTFASSPEELRVVQEKWGKFFE
ncbi:UbiD family decarboxylase [Chloroflexota bacterium]